MAMERGIQHYKWNQIDEAIIEFNKVKYLLDFKDGESLESAELLAQAHYNLGISYAKKELFNQAEQEILTAISIIPNPEYRNVKTKLRNKKFSFFLTCNIFTAINPNYITCHPARFI